MKKYFNILINIFLREIDFLINIRRKFFLFCLLFPILSFLILYGVFYSPVVRDVPVAVIDKDKSSLSQELILDLDANQDIKVAYKLNNTNEALKLISNLSIYAFVVIPEDFAKNVLSSRGAKVPFYFNSQLVLTGNMANKGIVTSIQGFSQKYNKIYEEHHNVPVYASEMRADPIIFNNQVLFNPYLNYQFIMLLGIFPALIQLFITGSFLYSYGFEVKTKRAEQLIEYSKSSPFLVVIGKGLPYFLMYLINILIMLLFLFFYIGINIEGSFLVILFATFLYLLVSASASLVLIFLGFASLRMALSLMAIYSAPAFAYGGITFPSLGMNKLALFWSEFLPITHYHRILINESLRGAGYNVSVGDILYMLIFFLVTLFAGTIMYRYIMITPKYWGRL